MVVKSYRDLQVWQKAMDLVVESYRVESFLPKSGVYGTQQLVSAPAPGTGFFPET